MWKLQRQQLIYIHSHSYGIFAAFRKLKGLVSDFGAKYIK